MEGNVQQHLTAAALLVVFNLNSQSSKVCLCMDPSHQSRSTNRSVNDSFEVGWPHIPDIAENLIKFQFNLVNAIGDISNFYTNNHLKRKAHCYLECSCKAPQKALYIPHYTWRSNDPWRSTCIEGRNLVMWIAGA